MSCINQLLTNFKKRKVYSSFRDNIWGVDLADMQSMIKYNKGIKYLLCAIDLFNKNSWVVPLKDEKGKHTMKENLLLLKDSLEC